LDVTDTSGIVQSFFHEALRTLPLFFKGLNMKCTADNHSLIVTRWMKRDTYERAEHFICQHCMRIFEWDKLVEEDSKAKEEDKNER
jgi:hypothetical protein